MKLKQTLTISTLLLFLTALLLSACTATSSSPNLKNTSWNLTQINGQPIVPNSTPTLAFDSERASGSGSCNSFGGDYTLKGNKLTFGPLMSTMMACLDNGIMDQEFAYLAALQTTASYEVKDGNLLLLDAQGKVMAEFSPMK